MEEQVKKVLSECVVEGLVIKLPPIQLERKLYQNVANKLQLIGGKWKGGKIMGFIFQQDPSDLLKEISSGKGINLKKQFQFFPTPNNIANQLVKLADIKEGQLVLEPSAGQGAIIEAIYRAFPRSMEGPNDKPTVTIDYCELMDINQKVLSQKISQKTIDPSRTSWRSADFMDLKILPGNMYDRIIANPPFSNNQDITHIKKMYDHLKPGGRLVSIASKHWQISNNTKETNFCEWLSFKAAIVIDLPAGEFKVSGTQIETCIIIIDKD